MSVGFSAPVNKQVRFANRRVALFAIGALVLLTAVSVASNTEQFTAVETGGGATRTILPIERDLVENLDESPVEADVKPIEIPQNVVIALAAVFGVGLLYLLSKQQIDLRFRRPSIKLTRTAGIKVSEEEQADAIAEFARDLIDELNEGDSPRYAIQRAYAAVETGFGAQELARKPAETPLRYLDRIFGRHTKMEAPLVTLTGLFQQARFSTDAVDETMRSEAIAALSEIRDYYQAFAWKKIGNRRSKADV